MGEGALESTTQVNDSSNLLDAMKPDYIGYWYSGDARYMFAPPKLYGEMCDVKALVLERIELLESVNRQADTWCKVVEGGNQDNTCTEHDVWLLRHRCMYIGTALKTFVSMAKPTSKWTWQQCLEDSIQKMNDLSVECYTHWRNLQRWHRKFVVRKGTFGKAPAKNTCRPQFFLENPDAQEAFKQHGIKCLKDLRVELMHEYVHDTMVPAMMNSKGLSIVSSSPSDTDKDGADDEQEISVDTKAEYLKSYSLSKLTIHTVARWMHAVGFRYFKTHRCAFDFDYKLSKL
jgi:hypothetical protein